MSVAWESDDELDIELVSDSGEEETEGELRSPGGVSRRREGTVERPAKRRKADASGEPSSLEQRRVLLREASGTAARWAERVRKDPSLQLYKRGKYSEREVAQLKDAVAGWCIRTAPTPDETEEQAHVRLFSGTTGKSRWLEIQSEMPHRSTASLRAAAHRWVRKWKTGPWSAEEEQLFRELVAANGGGEPVPVGGTRQGTNWALISEELGRFRHSCRDKWRSLPKAQYNHGRWTEEEETKLWTLVRKHAPFLFDERGEMIAAGYEDSDTYMPWKSILAELDTRSRYRCRHHFYHTMVPKAMRKLPRGQPKANNRQKARRRELAQARRDKPADVGMLTDSLAELLALEQELAGLGDDEQQEDDGGDDRGERDADAAAGADAFAGEADMPGFEGVVEDQEGHRQEEAEDVEQARKESARERRTEKETQKKAKEKRRQKRRQKRRERERENGEAKQVPQPLHSKKRHRKESVERRQKRRQQQPVQPVRPQPVQPQPVPIDVEEAALLALLSGKDPMEVLRGGHHQADDSSKQIAAGNKKRKKKERGKRKKKKSKAKAAAAAAAAAETQSAAAPQAKKKRRQHKKKKKQRTQGSVASPDAVTLVDELD